MHEAKLPAPAVAENVSRGHGMQVNASNAHSAVEYVPGIQLEQFATLVAPVIPENFPAGHCMHSAAPTPLYVPAMHVLHVDALRAFVADEKVPEVHDVHDVFPSKL